MKFWYLSFTFLLVISTVWSQKKSDFYSSPKVIYKGCDGAEDKEKCFSTKLHELLATSLNNNLKDYVFKNAKKDTLSIYAYLMFNEEGEIVKEYSNFSSSLDPSSKRLNQLLDSIPNVKPVLDDFGNGVSSTTRSLMFFLLDNINNKIVPIFEYQPKEVPFTVIENVPVYKGCGKHLDNESQKKCMSDKIARFVSKNFNIKLATQLNIKPGVVRIYVFFKIDKKGRITSIKARAPHKKLEEEAIRIIKKIPKMKRPGYQRGKPVIVPFSLPIAFRVTY